MTEFDEKRQDEDEVLRRARVAFAEGFLKAPSSPRP
jgi:hypothetical protein